MAWHVRHARAAEKERAHLKHRIRGVLRRSVRAIRRRRLHRRPKVWALIAGGAVVIALALSPWPPTTTLNHIAAFPNCAAAHAVGLAPAYRGDPGYWPWHDRGGDGIACEPWPHRPSTPSPRLLRPVLPR